MRLNWCSRQWYCTIVSDIAILVLWAASEYYESISARCYGTTLQWIDGGLSINLRQGQRSMIMHVHVQTGPTIFTLCPSTVLFPTRWTPLISWIRGLMMFAVTTVRTMHTYLCRKSGLPPHFGPIGVQSTMHTTMCITSLHTISAIRVQICVWSVPQGVWGDGPNC